jgi:hypothetical protein
MASNYVIYIIIIYLTPAFTIYNMLIISKSLNKYSKIQTHLFITTKKILMLLILQLVLLVLWTEMELLIVTKANTALLSTLPLF